VLVTSQEIDDLGEGDNLAQARLQIDGVLSHLRRGIRILADQGIETLVLTADHGHLFADEIDEHMKIESPGGQVADLHRRVWVGIGGTSESAYLRTSLAALGVESDLDIATPWTFAVFKAKGGGRAYFHGGLSPQELIVPVLVLHSTAKPATPTSRIQWTLTPGTAKLTTRFFSVQVTGIQEQGSLFGFEPPHVRLELRADKKCVSSAVSASYGFEDATGEVRLKVSDQDDKRIEPNTVMLMLTEDIAQWSFRCEVVTTLKTYCESGTFARGKDAFSGMASIAMFGNTNQPVDVMVRSSHLFMPMPDVIREDMAFLDRLHFYIPGWEIPKMRVEFFTDHYGFVVDYLAEALRELRKHNFTESIDHDFSLGSHLNARDVKAVRKTVSGLIKLIYPHGEYAKEELAELIELALEGRRRVKEQLKKMGAFEYHQTSFSFIDTETREERFVGVPEQGGRDMIATDPLAPGSVYTASVDDQGKVGLYRLEVGCSPGAGKLRIAGGIEGGMKESLQRAFAYLMGHKSQMGIAQQIDTTDFHVEAIDLLSNRVVCEAGIALLVAVYSAVKRQPAQAGLVILGDLSIQGNIKAVRSLAEPLQVAMDNGARRALVPVENKRSFLEVSGEIVERVDPVFFADPMMAAMKALGMT
jgi:hypothetical protein